jgi:hypothetical protein
MAGPNVSTPVGITVLADIERELTLEEIRAQFAKRPGIRAGAARGAIIGMLLGGGSWVVIIAAVTVILTR